MPVSRSLPTNVKVHSFKTSAPVKTKEFYKKNAPILCKAFYDELSHGKHIGKYLKNLKYYQAHFINACFHATMLESYLRKEQLLNAVLYSYWFNDWAYYLSILKYKKKIKSVVTRIHGGDVYEYQHTEKDFFFPFRNFQVRQLDKIVAISEDGAKHMISHYPSSRHKTSVSRLGTLDEGSATETKTDEVFVLASCSTFFPYKNVALIPKILTALKFKIKWIHFGDGGSDKEEVLRLIKQLPSNVTVELKGYTEHKDLFEFYRNNYIDLFINTSVSEGLPVSLMEAISFSIPVMAPNVGGIKELVNDTTGILFTHECSAETLAAKIEDVKAGRVTFDRQAIRNFWSENFSDKNYLNFYTTILCAA